MLVIVNKCYAIHAVVETFSEAMSEYYYIDVSLLVYNFCFLPLF
jgi:hypothetical protein